MVGFAPPLSNFSTRSVDVPSHSASSSTLTLRRTRISLKVIGFSLSVTDKVLLELSDLASLFQLGAGVSLALSVFKEPVSLAEERARRAIERDLLLIPNRVGDDVREKKQQILRRKAALRVNAVEAGKLSQGPKRLVWVGIALNVVGLLSSTLWANEQVSFALATLLSALSIAPYLVAIIWLQFIADIKVTATTRK